MKKVLAVLLAVMLMATMLPFSVFAAEENGNFNAPDVNTPQSLLQLSEIGSVFTTVAPATRVAVGCPSWSDNIGCLTVTLYKWDTDYETTVKGEPVRTQEFVDYEDNSMLGFTFEGDDLLPAGSYYIEVSDGYDDGGSGVGVWSGPAWPGQAVFVNGVYNSAMCLRMAVDYETEPEGERYGELPKFDDNPNGMGGDSKWPAPLYIDMTKDDNADTFSGTGTGVEGTVTEDGTLLLTVDSGVVDSQYPMDFNLIGLGDEISCKDYPFMAMRVRITSNYDAGNGEVFFYTSSQPGAAGGYSVAVPYDYKTDGWQTIIADGNGSPMFVTNAIDNDDCWTGMRFDVINAPTTDVITMEIAWIAFFQNKDAALAFDGDFGSVPTPEPTEAPTPTAEPTATPAPTEAPASDAEATKAPAAEEDKGCGSVITGSVAIVAMMAGGVLLLGKKKRK